MGALEENGAEHPKDVHVKAKLEEKAEVDGTRLNEHMSDELPQVEVGDPSPGKGEPNLDLGNVSGEEAQADCRGDQDL